MLIALILYSASKLSHSLSPSCLILELIIARLVLLVRGGFSLVASFARVSASSFPWISWWPGTQWRLGDKPLSLSFLAAFIHLICHSWPGLLEAVFNLNRAA